MERPEDIIRQRQASELQAYRQREAREHGQARELFAEAKSLVPELITQLNRHEWPGAIIRTFLTNGEEARGSQAQDVTERAIWGITQANWSVGSDGELYYLGVTEFDTMNEPSIWGYIRCDEYRGFSLADMQQLRARIITSTLRLSEL